MSRRINDAIPISGSSLVTLALLGARGHALTLQQIRAAIPGYLDFARRRGLPMTPTSALDSDAAVVGVLDGLIAQGVARSHVTGERAVFGIAPEQHLAAAFYRNTIVHHFLSSSIAELALLGAAEQAPVDRAAAFESEALAIRDLLKFDFFFGDREQFIAGVESEASTLALDWRERLAAGPTGVAALLETAPMLCSDMMLRSFFEAYSVVADVMASGDASRPFGRERASRPVHGTRPAVPAAGPAAQPRGGLTPPVSCRNRARPQSRTLVAGGRHRSTVAASSRQASRRCSAA